MEEKKQKNFTSHDISKFQMDKRVAFLKKTKEKFKTFQRIPLKKKGISQFTNLTEVKME